MNIVAHPLIARLTNWWAGLSSRERWLVSGLGVLVVLAALVYGVVKPLQAARATAIADIRTYETLNARIRAVGSLGPSSAPPPRTGPPEQLVITSAQGFGFAVQVQPQPGGATATVAEAGYDAVLNWLGDIARTTNLSVTRLDIQKRPGAGLVSATVEFRQ